MWNGTGANVMALATMVQPADFVLCTEWAHIAVDETGAPERALGAKIMPLAGRRRQAAPRADRRAGPISGRHAPRPAGRRVDHPEHRTRHGLHRRRGRRAVRRRAPSRHGRPHGRRPPRQRHRGPRRHRRRRCGRSRSMPASTCSASAARRPVWPAARPWCSSIRALRKRAKYVRKQVNQLPSKMRFVAAQFNALLDDDLWIRLAEHANAMGTAPLRTDRRASRRVTLGDARP